MSDFLETIINIIVETIKFIIKTMIWNFILFYLGVLVLKVLSLNNYPVGRQFEKHINVICLVGANTIYILWSSIATYNYSENIYFLVVGLVFAIIQFLVIAIKYYSQFRGSYEP